MVPSQQKVNERLTHGEAPHLGAIHETVGVTAQCHVVLVYPDLLWYFQAHRQLGTCTSQPHTRMAQHGLERFHSLETHGKAQERMTKMIWETSLSL